jgi:hypothetical protein
LAQSKDAAEMNDGNEGRPPQPPYDGDSFRRNPIVPPTFRMVVKMVVRCMVVRKPKRKAFRNSLLRKALLRVAEGI